MRLLFYAEVDSRIRLAEDVSFASEDLGITIKRNAEGVFARIEVLTRVPIPELFFSSVTPLTGVLAKAHVEIREDASLIAKMTQELQCIESVVSFFFPLTAIKWEARSYTLLFDNEEERAKTEAWGLEYSRKFSEAPELVSGAELSQLIRSRAKFVDLVSPLAFFREATNDFRRFRFINAFSNYYFVLEGLFGSGKTKNSQVKDEFKTSKMLAFCCREAIGFLSQNKPELLALLSKEMTQYHLETACVEDVLAFLVDTRGRIQHFSLRRNDRQGIPFFHSHYEVHASLIQATAHFGIGQLITAKNRQEAGLPSEWE